MNFDDSDEKVEEEVEKTPGFEQILAKVKQYIRKSWIVDFFQQIETLEFILSTASVN